MATLPHDRPVGVLDLATGARSNLRYLAERLPGAQRWLLIDRSAALLADAEVRTKAWAAEHNYDVHVNTTERAGPGRRRFSPSPTMGASRVILQNLKTNTSADS